MDDNLFYDVIIIGAGIGGLTAGNLLVKKGLNVCILEKNNRAGGYCVNFKRKDFRFDTNIHFINGCGKDGMVFQILREMGVEKQIEFIKLNNVFHWIDIKNGIDIKVPVSLVDHIEKLKENFPDEADNISKFYENSKKIILWLMNYSIKNKFGRFIFILRHFRTFLKFLNLLFKPISKVIDNYISDDGCKEVMTALCISFGLFREEMSALTFLMAELNYRLEGAYYPKGGAGELTRVLINNYINQGGKINYNREVTTLIYEKNEFIGLKAISGNKESFYKAKVFLSDCDITNLVTKLCPSGIFPKKYINRIIEGKTSYSSIIAFIGLNIDLKNDFNINDYEIWHFNSEYKNKEDIENAFKTMNLERIPIEMTTIYSNIDESCCPKGKSVVSVIYYAKDRLFNDVKNSLNNKFENYKQLKKYITSQLINIAAKALNIKNLEEYIEVIEVATPLTLKKFTDNREGAHLGWKMDVENGVKNQISIKSPVDNLFLTGQWVKFGGSVAAVMLTSFEATKRITKFLKLKN
jgi:prolycopene isomerase